ncbi:MAG: hypothetical protein JWR38_1585 [Mucilaginibacter sp.]|nr:hypothetical protein [Mucilaginibacter sp.]
MSRHNERIRPKKGAVTLSSVEGSSAEAYPLCFDGAQHDTLFVGMSFHRVLLFGEDYYIRLSSNKNLVAGISFAEFFWDAKFFPFKYPVEI